MVNKLAMKQEAMNKVEQELKELGHNFIRVVNFNEGVVEFRDAETNELIASLLELYTKSGKLYWLASYRTRRGEGQAIEPESPLSALISAIARVEAP